MESDVKVFNAITLPVPEFNSCTECASGRSDQASARDIVLAVEFLFEHLFASALSGCVGFGVWGFGSSYRLYQPVLKADL